MRLKINPGFQDLIPPLAENELRQLERNIILNGCRDALLIWKGVIVDGHNRYAICTKHHIPFKTMNLRFASENDAILWILENQLGRRNLSDAARIELSMQKTELMRLHINGAFHTRKTIAETAGVSEQTVQKYMKIKEIADPKLLARLHKGEEKISTAHRVLFEKTVTNICSAADLKAFNNPLHIARIKKLYLFIAEHISENNSTEDLDVVRKRLSAQCKVLERVLGA